MSFTGFFKKHLNGFGRVVKGLFKPDGSADVAPKEYDPWDKDAGVSRVNFWRALLEGKTISKLIVLRDKSAFGLGGVKTVSPGVIGFVIKGLGPVYIRPGAFGDSYGCFEVALSDNGKSVVLHDEARDA